MINYHKGLGTYLWKIQVFLWSCLPETIKVGPYS